MVMQAGTNTGWLRLLGCGIKSLPGGAHDAGLNL